MPRQSDVADLFYPILDFRIPDDGVVVFVVDFYHRVDVLLEYSPQASGIVAIVIAGQAIVVDVVVDSSVVESMIEEEKIKIESLVAF